MDTKTTLTDYYKLLKIAPNSGRDEIERAYREFHELYSPDTVGTYGLFSEDERAHMLKLINEAYEALTGHDVAQPMLAAASSSGLADVDKVMPLKLVTLKGEPVEKRIVSETDQKKTVDMPEMAVAVGATHISMRSEPVAVEAPVVTRPVAEKELPPSLVAVTVTPPPTPEVILEGGACLRALRDAHQLTLAEIAKRTRVSEKFLVAMESNDIPALPARVYVQGFVRLYLKHLNQLKAADAEKHLADYMKYYESKKTGA